MKFFDRQAAPDFWAEKEQNYLQGSQEAREALRWQNAGKTLAHWFHEAVRAKGEPKNCAYCDAELRLTSPETIDHFIPCHFDREQGLRWPNLYPSCTLCNSTYKHEKWSCALLRPDEDPVDDWLVFEPTNGRLRPAPELDRRIKARIRLTLVVFGLNHPDRCRARIQVWRDVRNARRLHDEESLRKYETEGPYRIVARQFALAAGTSTYERAIR